MTNHDKDHDESLKALGKRIDAKLEEKNKPIEQKSTLGGSRTAIELASAVGVGCTIGYYMDKWLDTDPIFFIIWVFLGVAAGVINIYKLAVKNMGYEGDSEDSPETTDNK